MKLFTFSLEPGQLYEDFTREINDWVNLHQEIQVIDYDFGYDRFGNLKTVVVKWK